VADELPIDAVIPEDFRRMPGAPLQHAPLLPAPGGGLAEIGPPVAILEVDHADADGIVCGGTAVFEVDFV
jgi:hypothetical protein